MSNLNDKEYTDYLVRLNGRYKANTAGRPVFTTNIDSDKLWNKYIGSYTEQQYHNCFACRHFLNRYAGLVVIDNDGTVRSALWSEEDVSANDPELLRSVSRMRKMVEDAKVTGVFYNEEAVLGQDTAGGWRHLHLFNPNIFKPFSRDSKGQNRKPSQEAAERQVDFTNTWRALREFSPTVVQSAINVLEANALYRGEKVLGRAKWLADLHNSLSWATTEEQRKNIVWLAVVAAPPGFARPRSSMIGTLLEDIAAGMSLKDIKARFDDKMDPSKYGRSQTAPTEQQVEIAEAAVEALGIAPAFERRYVDEFDVLESGSVLWQPATVVVEQPRRAGKKSGVFSDLAPAKDGTPGMELPAKTITWEKFARDVLPGAARIQYRVPITGRFGALTTAADQKAPPILQWDDPDNRNPVAWCFPNPPARAEEWNLAPGALVPVRAIVNTPNLWGDRKADHHGKGVFLLLEGARDTRDLPGGGLFVEHLRNDLKPYRSVIEAHLNRLRVQGAENPAFGIGLLAGHDWTERAALQQSVHPVKSGKAPDRVHAFLVVDDSGSMASYLRAAREAVNMLIDSLRAMPGKVDVTFIKFGSSVHILRSAASLDSLGGVVEEMHAASGMTALNDAIGRAIELGMDMPRTNATFFLGIVTDGEENHSGQYTKVTLGQKIARVLATGDWTIAYAGAGHHPLAYAAEIGIPEGNATVFEASSAGFEDVGRRYATSTRDLAAAYKGGARATTTFFGAASGRQAIGKDLPVLIVTSKSGTQSAYKLDRWE